jgi:hypothetical protein
MSGCFNLNVSKVVNEDGSATFTLDMCPVCYKCFQHVTPEIDTWLYDILECKASHKGDEVYKKELDRHLTAGTLSQDITKTSLILNSNLNHLTEETLPTS